MPKLVQLFISENTSDLHQLHLSNNLTAHLLTLWEFGLIDSSDMVSCLSLFQNNK